MNENNRPSGNSNWAEVLYEKLGLFFISLGRLFKSLGLYVYHSVDRMNNRDSPRSENPKLEPYPVTFSRFLENVYGLIQKGTKALAFAWKRFLGNKFFVFVGVFFRRFHFSPLWEMTREFFSKVKSFTKNEWDQVRREVEKEKEKGGGEQDSRRNDLSGRGLPPPAKKDEKDPSRKFHNGP